jgi:hypothetical protein
MSMLEDFWLPRREGGTGTSIETLPGGENLGQIDDVVYFQRRMYRSLNVPLSRLDTEAVANFIGRSSEINRDELKFQKFINRLRARFAHLFYGILKKQLILKGICTEEDWDQWKNDITVDFIRDNHFTELRDMEVLRERLQTLDQIQNYVGEYYSKDWVQKNILMLSAEDVENMNKTMDDEGDEEPPQQDQQPQGDDSE